MKIKVFEKDGTTKIIEVLTSEEVSELAEKYDRWEWVI
jgi:hypothetical protein